MAVMRKRQPPQQQIQIPAGARTAWSRICCSHLEQEPCIECLTILMRRAAWWEVQPGKRGVCCTHLELEPCRACAAVRVPRCLHCGGPALPRRWLCGSCEDERADLEGGRG